MEQAQTGRLWTEARETVRAVAADLGEVAANLSPVQPEQVEAKARILDRLSAELAEAAGMLRRSARGGLPRLGNQAVAMSAGGTAYVPARVPRAGTATLTPRA